MKVTKMEQIRKMKEQLQAFFKYMQTEDLRDEFLRIYLRWDGERVINLILNLNEETLDTQKYKTKRALINKLRMKFIDDDDILLHTAKAFANLKESHRGAALIIEEQKKYYANKNIQPKYERRCWTNILDNNPIKLDLKQAIDSLDNTIEKNLISKPFIWGDK